MKKGTLPVRELLAIIIGEAILSAAICGVYLLIGHYTYKVALGTAVGSAVTFLNFFFMSLFTNRVINSFMSERGDGELDDDAITELTLKYQGKVQAYMKLSFIIRTVVMLATLALAFFTGFFDVIATLIPLLALRPIITLSELLKGRENRD